MRRERTGLDTTIPFTTKTLELMVKKGFKYVQVKGFSSDKHYDYVEPHYLILFPMKELPTDQDQKDIYEPTASKMLQQWAKEDSYGVQVLVSKAGLN